MSVGWAESVGGGISVLRVRLEVVLRRWIRFVLRRLRSPGVFAGTHVRALERTAASPAGARVHDDPGGSDVRTGADGGDVSGAADAVRSACTRCGQERLLRVVGRRPFVGRHHNRLRVIHDHNEKGRRG